MKTFTISLFLLVLLLPLLGAAQQLTNEQKAEYLEELTENPEISGGMKALSKAIEYPKEAVEKGISGTVLVTAFIGKDGTVDATEVLKSDNTVFDGAALTAVKGVKFTPGKVKGSIVKARVVVPIKFRLD